MNDIFKTELIYKIQLHVCSSHLFTFHNTFFIETFKQYSKDITFKIVDHQHPLHHLSELPFAIVNSTHVVYKPNLLALLEAVSMQTPVRLLFFKPIFQLAQQIAAVGRIMNQSKNPYFLMFSPLKKFEIFMWNLHFKRKLSENTQYFNIHGEELDKQQFLYKLNTLGDYLQKINKGNMVTLCAFALMKSLKIDNQLLYKAAEKLQILKKYEQQGQILTDQIKQRIIGAPRFIAWVNEQHYHLKNTKKVIAQPYKVANSQMQLLSRLVIPAVILGIFWKVVNFNFSAEKISK